MSHAVQAAKALQQGGVLLVPTDTNYGLAADPWNEEACSDIFSLKQRDLNKPLTLFVAEPGELYRYAELDDKSSSVIADLIARFWPGPLNFVLPKAATVPDHRYFDAGSIAIVCNQSPPLRGVIQEFGRPIAMSSANISGTKVDGLVDFEEARKIFEGKVAYAVPPQENVATTTSSTIVRVDAGQVTVLRQGDVLV